MNDSRRHLKYKIEKSYRDIYLGNIYLTEIIYNIFLVEITVANNRYKALERVGKYKLSPATDHI